MPPIGGTDTDASIEKEIVAVVQRYHPELAEDEILDIARCQQAIKDTPAMKRATMSRRPNPLER